MQTNIFSTFQDLSIKITTYNRQYIFFKFNQLYESFVYGVLDTNVPCALCNLSSEWSG